VRAGLLDSLAKMAPSLQASVREAQVASCQTSTSHQPLAACSPTGSWRSFGSAIEWLASSNTGFELLPRPLEFAKIRTPTDYRLGLLQMAREDVQLVTLERLVSGHQRSI
jgi:hypothetical protein